MINFQGIPLNIEHQIIGKIQKEYIRNVNGNKIFSFLVVNKKSGFKCIITNANKKDIVKKHKKIPFVYGVKNAGMLNKGDIILLEPAGRVNIVYQKDSSDNSLLITQRCNCRCIMCPQPPVEEEQDRTPLNLNLLRLMDKNTPSLALTGGEPTLIRDDLLKIIMECKKELPRTSLILLTNGIELEDFDYVKAIVSLSHPDLTIAISLYSDIDKKHNEIVGSHSFYKTLKGIYNLALFRQKIEIRTVIHKLTYERLPNLAEFISYNFPFVIHVALMGLEPTGLALKNIKKLWIDPYEYRDILKSAVQIFHRNNLNVSIYNHQLCILPPSLWEFTRKSISNWKTFYLDTCKQCGLRNRCGGLFISAKSIHSNYLRPLPKISND